MPLKKRSSTEADREFNLLVAEISTDKENDSSQEELDVPPKASLWIEKRRSIGTTMSAPMSPMKRSEAPTNYETINFGSPSAKRRSLHGPGAFDFSNFESDPQANTDDNEERKSQEDNDYFRFGSPSGCSRFSTIPKRSSSLRKSTLQQRQSERSLSSRLILMVDTDPISPIAPPVFNSKKEGRMSLDNHLPAMTRESPFSSQGQLLSASIHPLSSVQSSQHLIESHPLSHTMTQSSTLSAEDDTPTHEPVHRSERRLAHDFSKSLPIGALRPGSSFQSEDSQDIVSQGSFATPGNYKNAKPLPAAFMSTGLISKKNRNVDEPNGGLPKAHMPDTPCKKQAPMFPPHRHFGPDGRQASRNARVSFGTPSTPFGTPSIPGKATPFPFAKNSSIFGNNLSKQVLHRKASFASIDGEKFPSPSPPTQTESQSTEVEFPPTPTKLAGEHSKHAQVSPSPHHQRSFSSHEVGSVTGNGTRFSSSKLSPIQASPGSNGGDSDSVMEDSPSANLRPQSLLTVPNIPSSSYTKGRSLKNLNSPTPLSRKPPIASLHSPGGRRTKLASLSPVSPHAAANERDSPHTPQEAFFPPDPSRLSISGRSERLVVRPGSSSAIAVPATPTGPRDYFINFSNRPSLNLNAPDTTEADESLKSRFNRIELVGTGEFSQVYRVAQGTDAISHPSVYSVSSSRPSSRGSHSEKVWAVKKSRYPYIGTKDRQRKIHEVDVLRALGKSDHVLGFVDSWEHNAHLYIQTEFCEEGTLDIFLAHMGQKARLDDFRIWKILLELGLGLKHIHDMGFMHLDLKPANVLITFEGVLKIGDFGMATKWPAQPGLEAEGDREYICPEVLRGQYDRPADIFALGLIMLETAGNVELPDNGASWQKLRNGDMSDVPSLTWSSEVSNISRDATGNPIPEDGALQESGLDQEFDIETSADGGRVHFQRPRKPGHVPRTSELVIPPEFMVDASHEHALDRVVKWMISPDPADRPVASEVLQIFGVKWTATRRRAGATVFEGNWGPADEVLAEDAEMIDV